MPRGEASNVYGERPDDVRKVYAFVREDSSFTLIEDDGVSLNYQEGGFTEVRLSLQRSTAQWTAEACCIHSGYPLPYSEVEFVVVTGDDAPVQGGILENGRWHIRVPVT
jgi:hypothetical protein